MKTVLKFVCLALTSVFSLGFFSILNGCSQTGGEGFAIYLTKDNIEPTRLHILSHIDLAHEPLLTIDDIVSYDQDTHTITLESAAFERIANMQVPVSGKSFAVCVDKQLVYSGAFWTPLSSISFDGVTIWKPLSSQETKVIQLELGYPSSSFYKGEDPRNNTKIIESLKQAGKLTGLEKLPHSMKGYELYSWFENSRWYFTIITGTNRKKTLREVISGASDFSSHWVNIHVAGTESVKAVLSKLPRDEWMLWLAELRNESSKEQSVIITLPDQTTIDGIKECAQEYHLDFAVASD